MKLEDQVASLELCKRLKELGVKQESYFYWSVQTEKSLRISSGKSVISAWDIPPPDSEWYMRYAAFTVAELFDSLPEKVEAVKVFDGYVVCTNGRMLVGPTEREPKLADTLAKYWIYLIENKLVNISAGMEGK